MEIDKRKARLRRARKTRAKIRRLGLPRLSVHRSGRHVYAQVINVDNQVLATANTLQKDVASDLKSTNNKSAAAAVGKFVAERALQAGVEEVAFDRSGFRYHGRVRALAEAARENGLEF